MKAVGIVGPAVFSAAAWSPAQRRSLRRSVLNTSINSESS